MTSELEPQRRKLSAFSSSLQDQEEGVLIVCGRSTDHQLGVVTKETIQWSFRPLRSLSRIVQVSSGTNHNLALNTHGQVFAWGSGKNGKLGLGDEFVRATPCIVNVFNKNRIDGDIIKQVSAGHEHSACVTQRGRVFTWGENLAGQLGLNLQQASSLSPALVTSYAASIHAGPSSAAARSAGIDAVACGAKHTLALSKDGRSIYGCGSNQFGELGISGQRQSVNRKFVLMDEAIDDEDDIFSASESAYSYPGDQTRASIFLRNDEKHGQRTSGKSRQKRKPSAIVAVNAGSDCSLLLQANGSAFMFGSGNSKPSKMRFKNEFNVRIKKCALSKNSMLFLSEEGRVYIRERRQSHGTRYKTPSVSSSHEKTSNVEGISPVTLTTAALMSPSPNTQSRGSLRKGHWANPRRLTCFTQQMVDVSCNDEHCCCLDEFGRIFTWNGPNTKGSDALGRGAGSVAESLPVPILKQAATVRRNPHSIDDIELMDEEKPMPAMKSVNDNIYGAFQASCGLHHTIALVGFQRNHCAEARDFAESQDSAYNAGKSTMFDFESDDEREQHERSLSRTRSPAPFPTLSNLIEAQLIQSMDCFNFYHCLDIAEELSLPLLAAASEDFVINNLQILEFLNPQAMKKLLIASDECPDEGEDSTYNSEDGRNAEEFEQEGHLDGNTGAEIQLDDRMSRDCDIATIDTIVQIDKVSAPVNEESPLYCEICDLGFASAESKAEHLAGKRHRQSARRQKSMFLAANIADTQASKTEKRQSQAMLKRSLAEARQRKLQERLASDLAGMHSSAEKNAWQYSTKLEQSSQNVSSLREMLDKQREAEHRVKREAAPKAIPARSFQAQPSSAFVAKDAHATSWAGVVSPTLNSSRLDVAKSTMQVEFSRTKQSIKVTVRVGDESNPLVVASKTKQKTKPHTGQASGSVTINQASPISKPVNFRELLKDEDDSAKRELEKRTSRPLTKSAWGFIPNT